MRLLSEEEIGGRTERWWLHTGDDGKLRVSVQTVQDVQPVFDHVKRMSAAPQQRDSRYRGSVPANVVEEACKIKAAQWGVSKRAVFSELMQAKTDRARAVWNELLTGRDFRKLQAQR